MICYQYIHVTSIHVSWHIYNHITVKYERHVEWKLASVWTRDPLSSNHILTRPWKWIFVNDLLVFLWGVCVHVLSIRIGIADLEHSVIDLMNAFNQTYSFHWQMQAVLFVHQKFEIRCQWMMFHANVFFNLHRILEEDNCKQKKNWAYSVCHCISGRFFF